MRRLVQVHKVLIGAAMGLGAVMILWGVTRWQKTHGADALGFAIGGAVAIVALAVYWAKVVSKYPKVIALLGLGLAADAHAQEARRLVPQPHEWRADVDVIIGSPVAYGIIDINYVYSMPPLQRGDVVVPRLRRFIHAPTELFARIVHDNGPIDTRSTLTGGGRLGLFDRTLFVGGSVGLLRNDVTFTRIEQVYYAAPLTLELGGRFGELVQVTGAGTWRPILGASVDTDAPAFAERSGAELEATFTARVATPGDRLLVGLRVGWWRADWDFDGFHAGNVTVAGPRATLELSYQLSASEALAAEGTLRSDRWDNDRAGEDDAGFIEGPLERTTSSYDFQVSYHYWFRGRLGFRVALGGGFEEQPPMFYSASPYAIDRPYGRIGLGFTSRY